MEMVYFFIMSVLEWIWEAISSIFSNDISALSAVEKQTEQSFNRETIWSFIHQGNCEAVKKLITERPSVMRERGPVGELPMHLCFLFGTEKHIKMAFDMIDVDHSLLLEEYNGREYAGENVLHIAIIKKRVDLVEKLVKMEPKLLHSRATGNFFKYGEVCYYGEYPVAFAIATSQFDIFNVLVKAGADLDVVDSNGNNILHVLVIQSLPEAYGYFKETWIDINGTDKRADGSFDREGKTEKSGKIVPWKRKNNENFTPFTLCATLGLKDMFHYLLEERKQVQWSYGPITCMLYPLDGLDDLQHREDSKVDDGALELILNGAHVELLNHPRIRDLIEKKWNKFGKRDLWNRFVAVSIYLIIFTYFAIKRQTIFQDNLEAKECNNGDFTRTPHCLPLPSSLDYTIFYFLFVIVVYGAAYKGWNEFIEMKNSGVKSYFNATGSAFLENTVSLSFFVLIIIFTFTHIIKSSFERLFLGLASFVGYSYLFFFLLALRLTGPMIIMIYQMLQNDVLRFCLVYSVFLIGFSLSFYVLNDNHGMAGFVDSITMCFEATFGDFNFGESHGKDESYYRSLSIFLLVSYIVVVSLCLLNLLIAMMGDTYSKVSEDAENQWHLERARVIMAIENEMTTEERKNPRNKYFVEIAGERYLQIYDNDKKHFATVKI